MIETFDAMAGRIDQLWRKNEDAAQALSQVAKQVLTEFSAQLDKLDPGSLAEAALRMDRPQFKVESPFGDPPVTWFMGDGYVIESYYWMRNTTSVHDHSFSGAWCTLLGSSVHRQFRFTMHQELTSSLSVGHLEQLSQERLLPGDVRMIVPGNDFIHDLFHLEQPTLTLIIRSCSSSKDSGLARQREYIGFGATAFAWQSFSRPSNERLSERLLTSLAAVDQPLAMRLFDVLAENNSPEPALRVLNAMIAAGSPNIGSFLNRFRSAFGETGVRLASALIQKRQNMLCRPATKVASEMLLFGLLRTPTNRDEIMSSLGRVHGIDNPRQWVVDQLEGVATSSVADGDLGLSKKALSLLRASLLNTESYDASSVEGFILSQHPLYAALL